MKKNTTSHNLLRIIIALLLVAVLCTLSISATNIIIQDNALFSNINSIANVNLDTTKDTKDVSDDENQKDDTTLNSNTNPSSKTSPFSMNSNAANTKPPAISISSPSSSLSAVLPTSIATTQTTTISAVPSTLSPMARYTPEKIKEVTPSSSSTTGHAFELSSEIVEGKTLRIKVESDEPVTLSAVGQTITLDSSGETDISLPSFVQTQSNMLIIAESQSGYVEVAYQKIEHSSDEEEIEQILENHNIIDLLPFPTMIKNLFQL